MLAGVALFALGARGAARGHQRARPRRALDRRHALRDPRRAAGAGGRRRGRDRRRDVRRAQRALAVRAPDVRARPHGIAAGQAEGRSSTTSSSRSSPTTAGIEADKALVAGQPRRRQRRVQRDGGEQGGGTTNIFGGHEGPEVRRGRGRQRAAAGGPAGVLRRAARTRSTGSRRCRSRPSSGPRAGRSTAAAGRRRRLDRLRRAARPLPASVSFSRAVKRHVPRRARSADRIVVIGATAPVLQDRHPTSWPGGEMAGPEIHANAIDTLLRGAPLHARAGSPTSLIALGARAAAAAARAAGCGRSWRSGSGSRPRCSTSVIAQVAFGQRADPAGGRAADRARASRSSGTLVGALADRFGRARADARPVLALRPRLGGRPGARARRHGGRRAARRRAADRDRPVQRPARLHELRRGPRDRPGDRRAEPLPDRDERRDPRPRRHARRLHGRRDHGRVRRPDRVRRPRRQGARRRRAQMLERLERFNGGCATRVSATASRWASGSTPAT